MPTTTRSSAADAAAPPAHLSPSPSFSSLAQHEALPMSSLYAGYWRTQSKSVCQQDAPTYAAALPITATCAVLFARRSATASSTGTATGAGSRSPPKLPPLTSNNTSFHVPPPPAAAAAAAAIATTSTTATNVTSGEPIASPLPPHHPTTPAAALPSATPPNNSMASVGPEPVLMPVRHLMVSTVFVLALIGLSVGLVLADVSRGVVLGIVLGLLLCAVFVSRVTVVHRRVCAPSSLPRHVLQYVSEGVIVIDLICLAFNTHSDNPLAKYALLLFMHDSSCGVSDGVVYAAVVVALLLVPAMLVLRSSTFSHWGLVLARTANVFLLSVMLFVWVVPDGGDDIVCSKVAAFIGLCGVVLQVTYAVTVAAPAHQALEVCVESVAAALAVTTYKTTTHSVAVLVPYTIGFGYLLFLEVREPHHSHRDVVKVFKYLVLVACAWVAAVTAWADWTAWWGWVLLVAGCIGIALLGLTAMSRWCSSGTASPSASPNTRRSDSPAASPASEMQTPTNAAPAPTGGSVGAAHRLLGLQSPNNTVAVPLPDDKPHPNPLNTSRALDMDSPAARETDPYSNARGGGQNNNNNNNNSKVENPLSSLRVPAPAREASQNEGGTPNVHDHTNQQDTCDDVSQAALSPAPVPMQIQPGVEESPPPLALAEAPMPSAAERGTSQREVSVVIDNDEMPIPPKEATRHYEELRAVVDAPRKPTEPIAVPDLSALDAGVATHNADAAGATAMYRERLSEIQSYNDSIVDAANALKAAGKASAPVYALAAVTPLKVPPAAGPTSSTGASKPPKLSSTTPVNGGATKKLPSAPSTPKAGSKPPSTPSTPLVAKESLTANSTCWDANDNTENPKLYCPGGYHPTQPGEVFNERYVAQKKLGWGEFSIVWLALDTARDDSPVALKISRANDIYQAASTAEVKLCRLVKARADDIPEGHEDEVNIERVMLMRDSFHHLGPNGKHLVCVLEKLGNNLLSLMTASNFQGLAPVVVKYVMRQILQGLAFLHDRVEIVHADLKPENVLMCEEAPLSASHVPFEQRYGVKISDLGSARKLDAKFSPVVLQTREYRAPEVILGATSLMSGAMDVWSAACMTFELLTGDYLFDPKAQVEDQGRQDVLHLNMMMQLAGDIPNSVLSKSAHVKNFFRTTAGGGNRGGNTFLQRRLPRTSLEDVLVQTYGVASRDARELSDFLMPMLALDPTARVRARDHINHKWLNP
eukprot:PhM_4_TR10033/c0_g1_i1/m.38802/K08832/SRPK3, STK23; serine/threonine-protein kinase SRPK3